LEIVSVYDSSQILVVSLEACHVTAMQAKREANAKAEDLKTRESLKITLPTSPIKRKLVITSVLSSGCVLLYYVDCISYTLHKRAWLQPGYLLACITVIQTITAPPSCIHLLFAM